MNKKVRTLVNIFSKVIFATFYHNQTSSLWHIPNRFSSEEGGGKEGISFMLNVKENGKVERPKAEKLMKALFHLNSKRFLEFIFS